LNNLLTISHQRIIQSTRQLTLMAGQGIKSLNFFNQAMNPKNLISAAPRWWAILMLSLTVLLAACTNEPEPTPAGPDQSTTPVTGPATGSTNGPAAGPPANPAPTSATYPHAGLEDEILQLVNQHRASKGLAALSRNEVIREESRTHSQDMASGKVAFGHAGFSDRVEAIKRKLAVKASAENVAYGYSTAQAVVKGWLNSEGHRKNIEGNYALTGIGIARNAKGTYYFTQIFIR
jgi:uncharacterized protein YkwD